MNKEQLLQAGLTSEQADAVLKMHAQVLDGNYVSKAVFNAEIEKVKLANDEIKARETQIAELGKFKGTAEELAAKVTKLEQDNILAKSEAEKKIEQLMQANELKFALTGKVLDVEDVLGKLDVTKLVFKDGKLIAGLEEQLVELKKAKPHWFPKEEDGADKKPSGWIFGNSPQEGGDSTKKSDDPGEFGRQLAQKQLESSTAAKKSADNYFKS